jgi:arylsulfatase A-like enzyme
MSAILYAAGPSLKQRRKLFLVRHVDIAPTVMEILGVLPPPTVDGEVLSKILKKNRD